MTHPLAESDLEMALLDPSANPDAWNAGMQAVDDFYPEFFDLNAASLTQETVSGTHAAGAGGLMMGDAGNAEQKNEAVQVAAVNGKIATISTSAAAAEALVEQDAADALQDYTISTADARTIGDIMADQEMTVDGLAEPETSNQPMALQTLLNATDQANLDALMHRAEVDEQLMQELAGDRADAGAANTRSDGDATSETHDALPENMVAEQHEAHGKDAPLSPELLWNTKQDAPSTAELSDLPSETQIEEAEIAVNSAFHGSKAQDQLASEVPIDGSKQHSPATTDQHHFMPQRELAETDHDRPSTSRTSPKEHTPQHTITTEGPLNPDRLSATPVEPAQQQQESSIYDNDLPFSAQLTSSMRKQHQPRPQPLVLTATVNKSFTRQSPYPSGPNTTFNTPLATPLLPSPFPDAAFTPLQSPTAAYDRARRSHSTPGAKSLREEMLLDVNEEEIDALTEIEYKGAKADENVPEALDQPFGVVKEKRARSSESSPNPLSCDPTKAKSVTRSPQRKRVKCAIAVLVDEEETSDLSSEQDVSAEVSEEEDELNSEQNAAGESDDDPDMPTAPTAPTSSQTSPSKHADPSAARLSGLILSQQPDFSSSLSSVNETVLEASGIDVTLNDAIPEKLDLAAEAGEEQAKSDPAPKARANLAKRRKQSAAAARAAKIAKVPAEGPAKATKKSAAAVKDMADPTKATKPVLAAKPPPKSTEALAQIPEATETDGLAPAPKEPKKPIGRHLLGKREFANLDITPEPEAAPLEPKKPIGGHLLGKREAAALGIGTDSGPEPKRTKKGGGGLKTVPKASPRKTRGQVVKTEKEKEEMAGKKPDAAMAAKLRRKSGMGAN